MTGRWRVLALMTGAQVGASLVQQALGSLTPFLVAAYALNATQLGAAFTAMNLGSAVFTAGAGLLTDRYGERLMLGVSAAAMVLALIGAAAAPTYATLIVALFVFGMGYAISTPAGGRAILLFFDRDRGFAMGVRQTGVPIGGVLGALLLPAVAFRFGYRGALAMGAVAVLVPTVIAVLAYRGGGEVRGVQRMRTVVAGMRDVALDPRFVGVTLTCMILVCQQYAANSFLVLTGEHEIGLGTAVAAATFAVAQGSAVCGRLGWGFASDRWFGGDRYLPLALICIVAAAGAAIVASAPSGAVVTVFVAAAIIGFTGIGWNGLFAAALAEIGGTERAGSALGLALSAIFATSSVFPIAFGALADHTSLRVAWWATAGLALLGVVPALRTRVIAGKGGPAAVTNRG